MTTYAISSRTTVDRPAAEVAAYVLDWTHDAEWRAAVRRFELEPAGPAVTGQRQVEVLVFAGLTFRTLTTVVEAAPRQVRYAGGSGAFGVAGVRTVTDLGDGRCEVSTRTELTPRGVMRVLAPLLLRSYRRADAADLRALAAKTS